MAKFNIEEFMAGLAGLVSNAQADIQAAKSENVPLVLEDTAEEGGLLAETLSGAGLTSAATTVQADVTKDSVAAVPALNTLATDGEEIFTVLPNGATTKLGITLAALFKSINGQ